MTLNTLVISKTLECTGNKDDFTIYTNLVYFQINAKQWQPFN